MSIYTNTRSRHTTLQIMSSPKAIEALLADSRSYWTPPKIAETDKPPSALAFLRDHVSQSLPLVVRGGASTWPALSHWSSEYLRVNHGTKSLSVSLTPDGHADAVTENRFAQPAIETWPLGKLLSALEADATEGDCIPYYSLQNSCLTDEIPELCADIDMNSIEFARSAFGKRETATNLWIGDHRSVTTLHADPFENLYVVVKGRKLFRLRPPSDATVLRKPEWRNARWERDGDVWGLKDVDGFTRWIDHNVDHPGQSLVVELHPGDILYLPPLWFHEVRQFGLTIAVNWWFDMTYGRDWVLKLLFDNMRDDAESSVQKVTPE